MSQKPDDLEHVGDDNSNDELLSQNGLHTVHIARTIARLKLGERLEGNSADVIEKLSRINADDDEVIVDKTEGKEDTKVEDIKKAIPVSDDYARQDALVSKIIDDLENNINTDIHESHAVPDRTDVGLIISRIRRASTRHPEYSNLDDQHQERVRIELIAKLLIESDKFPFELIAEAMLRMATVAQTTMEIEALKLPDDDEPKES